MAFRILGIYPVEQAPEPCFLFEIEFDTPVGDYPWEEVTQELPGQPRENWQVPWDERPLDDCGKRWAFFFHYLDLSRKLRTADGELDVISPSDWPQHLSYIEYEEPC